MNHEIHIPYPIYIYYPLSISKLKFKDLQRKAALAITQRQIEALVKAVEKTAYPQTAIISKNSP